MATFDLGRVTPIYRREYSASASYELNDVVLYDGNLYWHVQATATVGISPTDTTVWKLAFSDEGVRAEIRGYADDAQASKTAAASSASQASASASQAALSATSAQTAETGATTSAQTASTKASEATASAQSAASSAQTATDKATLATNKAAAASESASLATAKASAAATSETNAAASAQTASAKASEAAASATSAQKYDESAKQNAVNAQTAQGLAEQAQTAAETAQGLAEDARDEAQQIKDNVEAAIAGKADADDLTAINDRVTGVGDALNDINERLVSDYPKLELINIFDKNAVTTDSFVNYTNGNIQSTSVGACASDWIPVEAETTYVMSNGNNTQVNSCAFYNSNKEYISGIPSSGVRAPYSFTTPADASYMRWTVYNTVIDSTQIELGSTPTEYTAYQKAIQLKDINLSALGNTLNVPSVDATLSIAGNAADAKAVGDAIAEIGGDISDCPKLASVNLFNKSTITADSFINYTNGNVQATTVGACASDWIECEAETAYVMSNATNHQTNSCAFYDANKTYISGISTGGARAPYTFTTPANAVFMRWTVYNQVIDSTQIEKGSVPTPYSPYQKAVQIKDINISALEYALTKEITVGATGCDYTSILEALADTPDGTAIRVTTGTYDIAQEYTDKYGVSYWQNYAGYATTNPFDRGLWVTNGRKITMEAGVKLVFDLDGSSAVKNQFSVFATGFNAYISGGTIDIGQNLCRYAIHDDWGAQNGTNTFENIIFIGSPVSQSHIGGGMGYHLDYHIRNCVFMENENACDISYHNNLSEIAENRIFVEGCYGAKKCVFRWYGNSTKISHAIVHDCHFSSIYAEPHPTATPNTNVNVELTEWNNEKSSV